ncbi:MAG: type III pantothenate kinase, partial [Betaproteobacteria bacterium]|nr:type III pantothenate kinase [Betaproteobacteria bacterium]
MLSKPSSALIFVLVSFSALALYPMIAGQFGIDLVTKIMIYAILALSLELLVGGTGLYLRTLLDGIAPVPEIDPQIREAVEDAIDRVDGEVDWVVAREFECGVRNGYSDPTRLGADRWAALIGAYALGLVPGVIVSAGTALTVDMMGADGRFAGGIIVPGFRALDA